MREEAPVIWSEQVNAWVLTRYDDVREVLRDNEHYSSVRVPGGGLVGRTDIRIEQVAPPDALNMLNADRPDHTRLRKLLSLDFTPSKIDRMLPRIAEVTDDLLAGATDEPTFEVVTKLAEPLPVTVIAELLGIPSELGVQFKEWSDAAITPVPPHATDEWILSRNEKIVAFRNYLQEQIDRRHAEPTDDFIGRLVAAHDEESKLSDGEVLSGVNLLLLAGNETTTNLISNATLALTRFPERQAELRANPELIDDAIEEFLRYDGSVQFTFRTPTRPAEFHGQRIEKGETIIVVLASANRDARVFDDPNVLDFHRPKHKHVGFGDWIHICLGQFLARMETRAAMLGLLETFPSFELAVPESEVAYRPSFNLRGPSYMPIRAT